MSVKSERVRSVLFGKGTALFEAYMAGRHLEGRVGCMGRARIATEMNMRCYWVKEARRLHYRFLACIAKIKQLEAL